MTTIQQTNENNLIEQIDSWIAFRTITEKADYRLLQRLSDFPNSILITGCQRSGTTILSRVIRGSDGIVDHSFGKDDELDGALILGGLVEHRPRGRYCFQTTYVDQKYHEYFEHRGEYKMVWVVRNPYSTVYSLVHNWRRKALDHTFRPGAAVSLTGIDRWLYRIAGLRAINEVKRACLIYNWKLSHLFELYPRLGPEEMIVVDYDDLVLRKQVVLPSLYQFVDLTFAEEYGNVIHAKSVEKRDNFTPEVIEFIKANCEDTYQKAQQLVG